jgi:glycosyltransferase involved in cell wall biosynthesis
MNPLVSIIIPCFNAEHWVSAAIESALGQTWRETEVIAINDGSSDGSPAVLRRYVGPRVQVIDRPNRGAAAARNAGMRAAKGEFIQFLDADDLLTPAKIASQVALLGPKGDGVVGTARWARFQGDSAMAKEEADSPLFADLAPIDFLLLHTAGGYMMHPAAWLVPSAVARAAGPWDETLSLNDDGEYFARVALAAQGIVHAPDSLTLYRSHVPGSLSGRRDRRSLGSLYRSCELVAKHLAAAEDSPRVRLALADYFQRLAYEVYPEAPGLSRRAEARARELGGSALRPPMGRRQAWLARIVGWRLARRAACFLR